jgi:tetratricopeptide (TPR) repeat protein
VDEILKHWPTKEDARYAEIFEKELLPHIPSDRKADRVKLFIVLAEAHTAAAQGVAKTPAVAQEGSRNAELDLAFKALEEAVNLGFQDWAAEWSRIGELIDDPRFKLEWLPRDGDKIWAQKLVQSAVRVLYQNSQTSADRAARLMSAARERDPKNYSADLQYGRALCVAARKGSVSRNDAAAAFERASQVALSPAQRANAQVEIGNLWIEAGEWKKALDAFDAALREDPSNRMAKQKRPVVLEKLGQGEK